MAALHANYKDQWHLQRKIVWEKLPSIATSSWSRDPSFAHNGCCVHTTHQPIWQISVCSLSVFYWKRKQGVVFGDKPFHKIILTALVRMILVSQGTKHWAQTGLNKKGICWPNNRKKIWLQTWCASVAQINTRMFFSLNHFLALQLGPIFRIAFPCSGKLYNFNLISSWVQVKWEKELGQQKSHWVSLALTGSCAHLWTSHSAWGRAIN